MDNHEPSSSPPTIEPLSPQSSSPHSPTISPTDPRPLLISGACGQQQQQQNPQPTSKIHPSFHSTINYFATRLSPLVSCSTGLPHPDFPSTLLSYHLLTSQQLDSLAHHFHQVWPPVRETWDYPISIPPWVGTDLEHKLDLATKRRRFGRFIGLRGCASPVTKEHPRLGSLSLSLSLSVSGSGSVSRSGSGSRSSRAGDEEETEEEMRERLEREWEECFRRARQDSDAGRRKFGRFYNNNS